MCTGVGRACKVRLTAPPPCQVEDDPGFSHAADVRAAACTTLAFLACHPLGARGDACLVGPFRERLLAAGAFGALLRAALGSNAGERCDGLIQQTAAVGIMYLATMVRVLRTMVRGGAAACVRER